MTHVLRHRDFRLLWIGFGTSTIADRMVRVALILFVTDLTGSPSDVGLVLAAWMLPFTAFVVLGGVWADRLPRQRVMIGSDLISFALHALLAVLVFTSAVRIWHVVAIEACFGTAAAFFRPALQGLVPQTVPEEDIQPASALIGVLSNLGEFVGPALATALVLGLGAGWAFALDALTFLVSAGCVARVRARPRGAPVAHAPFLADLREGWTAVRSRIWVWATIGAFSAALLVAYAPWFVLGPVVAREEYGDLAVYGWVAAMIGLGTVAGTLLGARWRPERPLRLGLLLCLFWPLSIVLYAATAPLAVVIASAVAGGGGLALFEVWWQTALAQRIPPHQLSRVTSYDYLGSLTLMPAGYLLAGPVAASLGARPVLLGGGAVALGLIALALLPGETRRLRRRGPEAPVAPLHEPVVPVP
ncbi:MAG TPA: MFS transporter [Solirubrobacteraceae bacterium]|jgi:MFS family permease